MKTIRFEQASFAVELEALYRRPAFPEHVLQSVREILQAVRTEGDAAVCRCARQYDHVELRPEGLRVKEEELALAADQVAPSAQAAIRQAAEHLAVFARERLPQDWQFSPRPGVTLGERFVPLERVAAYVPGGAAPLVSTVLHTMVMARVAGVRQIVLCTPPRPDGTVNPAILFAAGLVGATEVYRLGGVYGVAALAYGTHTIPKVEKIVGPGNAYTTAAKRLVYGEVALDLVAGPSEVMIVADDTARADFIAADLLAQAEHGSGHEQAVLLTTTERLLAEVPAELKRQRAALPAGGTLDKVLDKGVFLILADDLDQAAEIAGRYAPEHLELHVAEPTALARRIPAAGAIFLGPWTPEPVGDFVAGPSHVLPTGGAARYFSGLTVDMFLRRMSLVHYEREAMLRELPTVEEFARLEELPAHGRSAAIRRQN